MEGRKPSPYNDVFSLYCFIKSPATSNLSIVLIVRACQPGMLANIFIVVHSFSSFNRNVPFDVSFQRSSLISLDISTGRSCMLLQCE